MTTAEEDFRAFRRLTAARAAHLEQTTADAYHDRYWLLRSRQSLAAFLQEFPTPAARQAAIEQVRELQAMRTAIAVDLRDSLEGFVGGQQSADYD